MVRFTVVLILGMLSMDTLASPLDLKVSVKGVQNGIAAEQSMGRSMGQESECTRKGQVCNDVETQYPPCCEGLDCLPVDKDKSLVFKACTLLE